jgi:hypothetical protein
MTGESRFIPVRFTRRPHATPQFSTGRVDIFRVGGGPYAAGTLVSHTVPSPYEHGFEDKGRTSSEQEVNR